jgi:hypothetical protein
MIDAENASFRLKSLLQELLKLGRFAWYRRLLLSFHIHRLLFLDYRRTSEDSNSADRTYGDTPVLTAYRIGQLLNLSSQSVWVEPGCGIGLVSLTMHLAFGCRVLAMEIEPHRHRAAELLAKSLAIKSPQVELLSQDFLKVAWPQQGCVYLTPTTWSDELWASVIAKLELDCRDATVVTVSRSLPDQHWKVVQSCSMSFSWGPSQLFVHQRRA